MSEGQRGGEYPQQNTKDCNQLKIILLLTKDEN